MKLGKSIIIFLIFLSGCSMDYPDSEKDSPKLKLAFIPSRNVSLVQRSAALIAEELGKLTGYEVVAQTFVNYSAVVIALRRGDIDIAFLGPMSFIRARELSDIVPVTASVRNGVAGYHGVIIAKQGSNIKAIEDLKGASVAFADSLSTSGYIYPRYALRTAGIDPEKDIRPLTIASHATIVLSVLTGKVDAGATYMGASDNPEVLSKFPDASKDTVVIWKSPVIPPDLQVVRRDLGAEKVADIQKAFITMANDPNSKVWLKDVYGIDDLIGVSDEILSGFSDLEKIAKYKETGAKE